MIAFINYYLNLLIIAFKSDENLIFNLIKQFFISKYFINLITIIVNLFQFSVINFEIIYYNSFFLVIFIIIISNFASLLKFFRLFFHILLVFHLISICFIDLKFIHWVHYFLFHLINFIKKTN